MTNCNVTGHWQDLAVVITNFDYVRIVNSRFWENFNGCIYIRNRVTCSPSVSIYNNNFNHNKGTVVSMDSTECNDVNILIHQNVFSLNVLNNRLGNQYIVETSYLQAKNISLSENEFYKNNVKSVIALSSLNTSGNTEASVDMHQNIFQDNIALDIIVLNVSLMQFVGNIFNNPASACDLRSNFTIMDSDEIGKLRTCGKIEVNVSMRGKFDFRTSTDEPQRNITREYLIEAEVISTTIKSRVQKTRRLLARPDSYVLLQPLVVE